MGWYWKAWAWEDQIVQKCSEEKLSCHSVHSPHLHQAPSKRIVPVEPGVEIFKFSKGTLFWPNSSCQSCQSWADHKIKMAFCPKLFWRWSVRKLVQIVVGQGGQYILWPQLQLWDTFSISTSEITITIPNKIGKIISSQATLVRNYLRVKNAA